MKFLQALCQAKWLEEVRKKLLLDVGDDEVVHHSPVSLNELRRLIQSGVLIPSRGSVERAMAELQELLTVAEGWEEKALSCMSAKLVGHISFFRRFSSGIVVRKQGYEIRCHILCVVVIKENIPMHTHR